MKPLKESLVRGRDVLSRTMAGSGREEGFGDVGRLLGRKGFGCLNEIIIGSIRSKVYREVFFRVRPLFYAQILLRFQSRRLVPRITMNLYHQLGGIKKRKILKSKISTSPKLKEDGLCQQGKLQVVRRGWCESGVECCELWTLDGQQTTCQNVEDVHQR